MGHVRGDIYNGGFIDYVFFHLFTEEEVDLRVETAEPVGRIIAQENEILMSVVGMSLLFQQNRFDEELPSHVDVSSRYLIFSSEVGLRLGYKG